MAPPKKNYTLTQTDFDRLISWLDADREQAALKYEQIRRRLIVIFAGRRCDAPEELADETIDRAARKIAEIETTYAGDKSKYFFGVANYIYQEYLRRKSSAPEAPPIEEKDETSDSRYECLENCLAKMPEEARRMIIDYYAEDKRAKIDFRKNMADKFDISGNALRHRSRRLRLELKKCVEKCLSGKSGDMNRG